MADDSAPSPAQSALEGGRRNRSSEEFAMRRAIEPWARQYFPGARMVHELVVANECRVDMAFIGTNYIVGVEIKTSVDTLDRLANQARVFKSNLSATVIALAPKWANHSNTFIGGTERITCDGEKVYAPYFRPRFDLCITTPMLQLLWADEARSIAARKRLSHRKAVPLYTLLPLLAQKLTGEEIVREVCAELRARDAFPKSPDHPPSDPPIPLPTQTDGGNGNG